MSAISTLMAEITKVFFAAGNFKHKNGAFRAAL
jgi:hypothetical protein